MCCFLGLRVVLCVVLRRAENRRKDFVIAAAIFKEDE
jgi:hypothetical protein